MKKRNNKWEEYSDREWEFLASCLSGENGSTAAEESYVESESKTAELWKSMEKIRGENQEESGTDRAWATLHGRLKENNLLPDETTSKQPILRALPDRKSVV